MKVLLHFLGLFILGVTHAWPVAHTSLDERNDRPNILMIFVDDLNDYLGCLNHPNAQTPNMDRLSEDGTLFLDAHAQAPLCGPSRASIMTGLRPSTTGIYGQIDDEDIREASEMTRYVRFLPEYLKDHGYYTMGIGKLFHRHAPDGVLDESGGRNGGFGPKPPNGAYFKWKGEGTSTDWGAYPNNDDEMPDHQSTEWAVERLERAYERPFFLGVGFFRPHVPWYVPQKWFDLYDTEEIVTPPYEANDWNDIPGIVSRIDDLPMMPTTEWAIETGEWKNIVEAYLASVTFVDHQIGKVLLALERSPYADNTVVILLSDHGYRLGEKGTFAKNCLWQEGTRVPLIMKGPGIIAGGRFEEPVELLDIYPTILDLAGLPKYDLLEGKSLRPALEGKPLPTAPVAITTYGRNNHSIISRNFQLIRYEDGSEELYDRWKDPNAFANVAGDATYANVRRELENHFPVQNRLWAPASESSWPAYFVKQREAQMAASDFYVPEALSYCVTKAEFTANHLPSPDAKPVSIAKDEFFWELKSAEHWGWTHGFWPGILWYAYEASGSEHLKAFAIQHTRSLEGMLARPLNSHDIGFDFICSYGNAFRLTGERTYAEGLVRAADKLISLFNPNVGTLMSWPNKAKDGQYAPHNTIIDSLLNLELLFKASDLSGNPVYREIAVSHADHVMKTHIRPDFSTYHLAVYDDQSGEVLHKGTHQGYADDSLWARGQAWGIYGFTMCYRETGYKRYLESAEKLANVFLTLLPEDSVPYWDFGDPAIPDAPRDASAAAIAASGFLEMSLYIKDKTESRRYYEAGRKILEALSTPAYRSYGRNAAMLDHSTGSNPRDREVDVPLIYADYYYLEGLLRLREIGSRTTSNQL